MPKYIIYERKHNKPVSKPYTSIQRARGRVDALDNAYGCYHHYIKTVEENERNVL